MINLLLIDPADFIGGAELFNTDIANRLIQEKNYNVHLATQGKKEYIDKFSPKVIIHKISLSRLKILNPLVLFRLLKSLLALRKLVQKEKIDLIQSNSIRSHIIAAILSLITKVPCIFFVHDFTFPKLFCYPLANIPKSIICSSESVRKDLFKKISAKNRQKIAIIPNGFDLKKLNANLMNKKEVRAKYQLPAKTKIIALFGRIDWWKGQKEFIKAANLVLQKNSNCLFLIVGDANTHDRKTLSYKNDIIKLIDSFSLKEKIILLGQIKNVYDLMSGVDIIVHSSIRPEPFGRVIVEAMALKIPIIASSMGGPSEIIENNQDGLLWETPQIEDLAEKILFSLNNEDRAEKMAEMAFLKVKNFYSLESCIDKLKKIHLACANKKA